MLVFTVKGGDMFHIGEEIRVRIIRLKGGQIRVGIEAPRGLDVDRDKVRQQKRKRAGA